MPPKYNELDKLQSILSQSKTQRDNPALYQTILGLIHATQRQINGINNQITTIKSILSSGPPIDTSDFAQRHEDNAEKLSGDDSFTGANTFKGDVVIERDNPFVMLADGSELPDNQHWMIQAAGGDYTVYSTDEAGDPKYPNRPTITAKTTTNNTTLSGAVQVYNKNGLNIIEIPYANRETSPAVGTLANFTDGSTSSLGAIVIGGGSNRILARFDGTDWRVAAPLTTVSGGSSSELVPHQETHEPGGTDEIVSAAWVSQSNTFNGDQIIDGDLLVTGTITPATQEQKDNIDAFIGDPTGARMLMSEDYNSGLSLRHDDVPGLGRIACGNYTTQTYEPLLIEAESVKFRTGLTPPGLFDHVVIHSSGGMTVGEGTDHDIDPGTGIISARGLNGTPLNASNLTSGTVPDARLSVNVLKFTGGYPGGTTTFLRADGTFASPGLGNVVGPASATDNAIARYDLTTGKLIQNSLVTIDDSGNFALPANSSILTASGALALGGNSASAQVGINSTGLAPIVDNVLDLGGTANKWKNAYIAGIVNAGGLGSTPLNATNLTSGTVPNAQLPSDIVRGPASATDNAIARFDLTTGKLIQNSLALIGDSGQLVLGTNPATAGIIALPNNAAIYARNAANTADILITYVDPSNVLQIGSSNAVGANLNTSLAIGGYVSVQPSSGEAGLYLKSLANATDQKTWLIRTAANGTFAINSMTDAGVIQTGILVDRSANTYIPGSLALGSNYAQAGTIRLPNSGTVFARNAANTGDVNVLNFFSDNKFYVGAGGGDAGLVLRSAGQITAQTPTVSTNDTQVATTAFLYNIFNNWISPAVDQSYFGGSGAMGWTVDPGDIITYRYLLVSKTLWWELWLDTTSLTGTANTTLVAYMPGGWTFARSTGFTAWCTSGGGHFPIRAWGIVGQRYMNFSKTDLTNFPIVTNSFTLAGTFIFEIS